ncbi:hypothetical protein RBH35_25620, partial [Escherichia coli]
FFVHQVRFHQYPNLSNVSGWCIGVIFPFLFIEIEQTTKPPPPPPEKLINSEKPRGRRPVTVPHAGKDP